MGNWNKKDLVNDMGDLDEKRNRLTISRVFLKRKEGDEQCWHLVSEEGKILQNGSHVLHIGIFPTIFQRLGDGGNGDTKSMKLLCILKYEGKQKGIKVLTGKL